VRPISTEPIRQQTRMRRQQQQPPRRPPWSTPLIAGGIVLVGVAIVAAVFVIGRGGSASASPGTSVAALGENCPTSQPAALPAGQTRTVTITTTEGDIVIQVKADLSPIAAGNFVALASCGFYDGLVFHRVVPDFVIQGGDPKGDGTGGPGYTIKDEPVTATYGRGTVAMARNSQPDSQGSQFFIVLSDDAKTSLASANTYAIFGTVVGGMDVVDTIATAADKENPTNPIEMVSVKVATP
jgi:cyclophilin family peptidyl-prolyl cis-trans isomerase